eukprot:Partr_v1_DN26874_c0_g1_i1_m40206 putative Coiled-coil domain containing 6
MLRSEIARMKKASVEWLAEHEQEEEMIANKLLRKIDTLQLEKRKIMDQMETEEELIANSLKRRLSQLEKEKLGLEIALETESEFMVNRMAKERDAAAYSGGGAGGSGKKQPNVLISPFNSTHNLGMASGNKGSM